MASENAMNMRRTRCPSYNEGQSRAGHSIANRSSERRIAPLYDGHLVRREHVERAVPGRATLDDQVHPAGTGDTPFENRLVRHGRAHWCTTKHTKSTKVSAHEAFDASFQFHHVEVHP